MSFDEVRAVAGSIAREIGGPLTAIEVAVDRLRRRCDDVDDDDDLRAILDQSHRLAGLARTLLALAQPLRPRIRRVELNRSVCEVVTAARGDFEARGVRTALELDPALPTVLADPHQLRDVLLALLRNAWTALEGWEGDRVVRIETRKASHEMVEVEITDSGPGVPPDEVERIFLPFVSGWGGKGVGLSLSRMALERHGGKLVLGEEGRGGASFLLRLSSRNVAEPDQEPSNDDED